MKLYSITKDYRSTVKSLVKENDKEIAAFFKEFKIKLSKYYDETEVKNFPTFLDDILGEMQFAGCPIFKDALNNKMSAGDLTLMYAVKEALGYIDSWLEINEKIHIFQQVSDNKKFIRSLIKYVTLYIIRENYLYYDAELTDTPLIVNLNYFDNIINSMYKNFTDKNEAFTQLSFDYYDPAES